MENSSNLTLTRRRQRRPDLQTACTLPDHLSQLVAGVEAALASSLNADDTKPADVVKAMKATCNALQTLRTTADTPELQLRAVSKITSSVRECRLGHPEKVSGGTLLPSERAFMDALILQFVFPFLLDCRVRYLHKALTTLFRTTYVMTEATCEAFEAAFLHSLQQWCDEPEALSSPRPADSTAPTTQGGARRHLFVSAMSTSEAGQVSAALKAAKERVMYFLNSLDGLSSTLMPMMPSVFSKTLLTVLPLLGECLQWAVEHALVNSSRPTGTAASTTATVFGEDLEHVRFCARVVATYMHKYMGELTRALQLLPQGDAAATRIHHDLARLLWPTALMFSSEAFPKDVLNAAGLLFASLLTVCACDTTMLVSVCRAVCEEDRATPCHSGSTLTTSASRHLALAEAATAELCSTTSASATLSFVALSSLCTTMTKNARFAVLKGLLAHLSAPISGSVKGLSTLMLPAARSEDTAKACVPLYDIILPYAERYANALSEPETRFMAIQCMDSVVRHLGAVLTACQQMLLGACDASQTTNTDPTTTAHVGSGEAVAPQAKKAKASLPQRLTDENVDVVRRLLPACLPSSAMVCALQTVTQLTMGLWDDGTQQISGTLYGTYDEVLRVQVLSRWFQRILCAPTDTTTAASRRFPAIVSDSVGKALFRESTAAAPFAEELDLSHALRDVLTIQNERRGKYHALLGLMAALPSDEFLSAVTANSAAGLERFSVMLLGGATNHKIGNVCGEVFSKTVFLVRQATPRGDATRWEVSALLRPLAAAIVVDGYVHVASNVDTATAISNLVAHFATPLLRQDAALLPLLLEAVGRTATEGVIGDNGRTMAIAMPPRAVQGVVEIISRARSSGLDVTHYLAPGNDVFAMLQRATQALSFDLRNAALSLLVLTPKKAEPAVAWQCDLVEAFVSLNLQLGGDNTARKMLFETLRKWLRRLQDTFGASQSPTSPTAYQSMWLSHTQRLGEILVAHIGTPEAPLAVERRVAAMSIFKMLLSTLVTALGSTPQPTDASLLSRFFVASAVPMLLTDLSDGWEMTRKLARELLELYAQFAPTHVFEASDRTNVLLSEGGAYDDLVRARTYRNAEGAVHRFALAVLHRPDAARQRGDEYTMSLHKRLVKEAAMVEEACHNIETLTGPAALEFVVTTPLHGRLSLCLELITPMLAAGATVAKNTGNVLLHTSSCVLTACSGLVGAGAGGQADTVDCRGHVFTKGDPGAEATMRRVVNNTWLSVRVAASIVARILGGVKVDSLDYQTVRDACYALVRVLLCTKHNGVMRCARESLKVALEILIRTRDEALHDLPREMLNHLLGDEGVTSTDAGRMLRRSQGLPHAILAVLEAEDNSMPHTLFPVAMTSLLNVAKSMHAPPREKMPKSLNAPSGHQPLADLALSQCSNALNVLKFVFEDRTLSDRAVGFLEEAFTIATSGFNHTSWYIRNSCLMLFASVLQRLIGEHPSLGGAGVNTSLHDLEKRVPHGVTFALATLHTAQETETLALFPILQMLSMLSPDPPQLWRDVHQKVATEVASNGADDTSAAMVKAVTRCGGSTSLMVRSASAVALASVVPVDAIRTVMLRVAQPFHAAETPSAGSLNVLHGALLQLHQFHRQYVGTVFNTGRLRHLSGYATPDVRRLVSSTTAHCLRLTDDCTRRRLARCPTTVASLFSLLADVLTFGHDNDLSAETEDALIQLAGPFITSSFLQPPALFDLTDRGAVSERASAVLLASIAVVTRPGRSSSDARTAVASTGATMSQWGLVLAAEQRRLLNMRNVDQHQDLVTSLLETYLAMNASSRPALNVFVSALAERTNFDVCDANRRALEHALAAHRSHHTDRSEHWLGCVTSGALTTHTRFALHLAQSSDPQLSSRVLSDPDWQQVIGSFRTILCAHTANTSASEEAGETHARHAVALETEAPAVALLTTFAAASGAAGVDADLVRLLTFYSDPDQAEVLRRVVVDSLRACFKACTTNSAPAPSSLVRASLLFLLLRLLCDDASAVREAACCVCSEAAVDPTAGHRDQFTCVLSAVKALQQCTQGMASDKDVMRHLCGVYLMPSEAEVSAPTEKPGETGNEEEDDGDASASEDGEEVLFEKEADNMFAERGLMAFLQSRILAGPQADHSRGDASTFPVFDRLLTDSGADRDACHPALSLLTL